MAIAGSDIKMYFTTTSGSAGNTTAGTAATSLGKYMSTTEVTDATLQNVFRNITGAEASAGITLYRGLYILNNHASLTYVGAQVLIASQTSLGGTVTVATDNVAVSAKGSASAQGTQIASETTAPSSVSAFGTSAITIGDIAAGSGKMIWLKLVVSASTASINPDGVIVEMTGDTLP